MSISRLDQVYRKLVISKFFTRGWGKPENLIKLFEFRKLVSDRKICFSLVDPNHQVIITKEVESKDSILLEGHFLSPFYEYLPDLLPKEAQKAHFQVLLPKKWPSPNFKPMCLHLAGTGDHFFFRRRNLMAKPLIKEAGIGAILLENPFYGLRKPKDQVWSCLHNVSDIFVMGGCLILESLVLFHWCKRNGLGPFGVTGISMGGHMASLAATNWPEPIVLVPCLSWSTASIVFTRGVMSGAINWDLLETQYFDNEIYSKEIQRMVKVVDDFLGGSNSTDVSYEAGQHFAKHFPESLNQVDDDKKSETETYPSSSAAQFFSQFHPPVSLDPSAKKDALFEVLQEANELQYARFLDNSVRKSLELSPISIRDYLAFRNKGEVPEKKKNQKEEEREAQRREASKFMCGIMDECTHLSNFSVPVDPELVIAITARDDAYVPRDGIADIRDIWKGAEVRYLNAGHVGAYLLHQKVFRTAITDGFDRMKAKYYNNATSSSHENEEEHQQQQQANSTEKASSSS